MDNLTNLTLDQLLYFNGVSKIIEKDNKKIIYSVEINYPTDNRNLLDSKVQLILKQGKKIISIFNLDKLLLIRDDKNNFSNQGNNNSDNLDLSIFDDLILGLSIYNLDRVDQNLYIFCKLLSEYIKDDVEKQKIMVIDRVELFNLVIKTGKDLEQLNIAHTLEFSRLYRLSLRQISKLDTENKTK